MASPLHQTLVDLLRHAPEVVPRLLAVTGVSSDTTMTSVQLIDSVLDQIQRRVDLAVEIRREGAASLAVGLEIQLAINPDKLRSWPVYVTTLRSQARPTACLLILAPDPRVAAWAARPIDLGPGNPTFRVHVIGPDQIPRIADVEAARRQPELGFLSALAHAETDNDPELLRAALAGLGTLDSARTSSYVSVLFDSLSVGLRHALETCMIETSDPKPSSVTPEFVERAMRWANRDIIEAYQRHLESRHQGELHARREILVRLLTRVGLHPGPEDQAKITECEDTTVLDRWIEQSLGAKDIAEVLT